MDNQQISGAVEYLLRLSRNNPRSKIKLIVNYEGFTSGVMVSLPARVQSTDKLIQGIIHEAFMGQGQVEDYSLEVDQFYPENWLVVFHSRDSETRTYGEEWEVHSGRTEPEVREDVTANRRHLDYGRAGYSLIRIEHPQDLKPIE